MASTSGDVADAVAATITALSLTPTPAVRKRARPAWLDGDPSPLVVVVVGQESPAEVMGRQGTARRVHVRYPVRVAVGFRSAGKANGTTALREWHDDIRAALLDWKATLAANGLPGVNEVAANGGPIFDDAAARVAIDWAEAEFLVEVATEA